MEDNHTLHIALTRIEGKVEHIDNINSKVETIDKRLRELETSVIRLEENQPTKITWWQVSSGIGAIFATMISLTVLLPRLL